MLDKLKKYFKPEEENVEMTTETNQAELSVELVAAELTELKASFAQVSETLATTQAALEAANAELAKATAALAEVEEAKAAAEAAAAQAKVDARMAKIVEAVGEAQAADLMEATKELNDDAFGKVVAAMSKNIEVEAKSELFTETGVDAEVKPQAEQKPVSFKNFIPKSK